VAQRPAAATRTASTRRRRPTTRRTHRGSDRRPSSSAAICLKDPYDGIERAEADAALDTLIGIAKEYPDEEYIPAVRYREWLTNPGIDDLRARDPVFTGKLDQAVAELNQGARLALRGGDALRLGPRGR
jgi:hypothetical protein